MSRNSKDFEDANTDAGDLFKDPKKIQLVKDMAFIRDKAAGDLGSEMSEFAEDDLDSEISEFIERINGFRTKGEVDISDFESRYKKSLEKYGVEVQDKDEDKRKWHGIFYDFDQEVELLTNLNYVGKLLKDNDNSDHDFIELKEKYTKVKTDYDDLSIEEKLEKFEDLKGVFDNLKYDAEIISENNGLLADSQEITISFADLPKVKSPKVAKDDIIKEPDVVDIEAVDAFLKENAKSTENDKTTVSSNNSESNDSRSKGSPSSADSLAEATSSLDSKFGVLRAKSSNSSDTSISESIDSENNRIDNINDYLRNSKKQNNDVDDFRSVDLNDDINYDIDDFRSVDLDNDFEKESEAGDEISEAGDEISEVGDEISEVGDEISEVGDEISEVGDEISEVGDDTVEPGDDLSKPGVNNQDKDPINAANIDTSKITALSDDEGDDYKNHNHKGYQLRGYFNDDQGLAVSDKICGEEIGRPGEEGYISGMEMYADSLPIAVYYGRRGKTDADGRIINPDIIGGLHKFTKDLEEESAKEWVGPNIPKVSIAKITELDPTSGNIGRDIFCIASITKEGVTNTFISPEVFKQQLVIIAQANYNNMLVAMAKIEALKEYSKTLPDDKKSQEINDFIDNAETVLNGDILSDSATINNKDKENIIEEIGVFVGLTLTNLDPDTNEIKALKELHNDSKAVSVSDFEDKYANHPFTTAQKKAARNYSSQSSNRHFGEIVTREASNDVLANDLSKDDIYALAKKSKSNFWGSNTSKGEANEKSKYVQLLNLDSPHSPLPGISVHRPRGTNNIVSLSFGSEAGDDICHVAIRGTEFFIEVRRSKFDGEMVVARDGKNKGEIIPCKTNELIIPKEHVFKLDPDTGKYIPVKISKLDTIAKEVYNKVQIKAVCNLGDKGERHVTTLYKGRSEKFDLPKVNALEKQGDIQVPKLKIDDYSKDIPLEGAEVGSDKCQVMLEISRNKYSKDNDIVTRTYILDRDSEGKDNDTKLFFQSPAELEKAYNKRYNIKNNKTVPLSMAVLGGAAVTAAVLTGGASLPVTAVAGAAAYGAGATVSGGATNLGERAIENNKFTSEFNKIKKSFAGGFAVQGSIKEIVTNYDISTNNGVKIKQEVSCNKYSKDNIIFNKKYIEKDSRTKLFFKNAEEFENAYREVNPDISNKDIKKIFNEISKFTPDPINKNKDNTNEIDREIKKRMPISSNKFTSNEAYNKAEEITKTVLDVSKVNKDDLDQIVTSLKEEQLVTMQKKGQLVKEFEYGGEFKVEVNQLDDGLSVTPYFYGTSNKRIYFDIDNKTSITEAAKEAGISPSKKELSNLKAILTDFTEPTPDPKYPSATPLIITVKSHVDKLEERKAQTPSTGIGA